MLSNSTTPPEYRTVPGHEDYRVGDNGSVWSKKIPGCHRWAGGTWRKLEAFRNGSGYLCVTVGRKQVRVHRLVLEAFVGPCPEGMECRHLDGNPTNNRLENLCWGSKQENMDDRSRHGAWKPVSGERHGSAKLTASDVIEIRKLVHEGRAIQADLAKRYGVRKGTMSRVVSGALWKHLPCPGSEAVKAGG